MKRALLKLCILAIASFFTKPIYAAEANNCACMEYEDIKTEKEVYESPETLRERSVEFSEFELPQKEDVLLAEF